MLLRSIIAMLMVVCLFQVEAEAQRWRPLQQTHRYLGLWSGSGYHHCAPGPHGGYYNPYTAHNSGLVSQGYIPPNMMMNHSPQMMVGQSVGQSVVIPQNNGPFPPAPLGGSYESFDDDEDTDVEEDTREDLKNFDDEEKDIFDPEERDGFDPEEKDGFEYDKEKTLEDRLKDFDDEKVLEQRRDPNGAFELPEDSLDYSLLLEED